MDEFVSQETIETTQTPPSAVKPTIRPWVPTHTSNGRPLETVTAVELAIPGHKPLISYRRLGS